MKCHSAEYSILQTLNRDETRNDPWNPAPNLLYAAERGDDDVVLCFERLFDCDDPPLRTVANVIDYISQALEVSENKKETELSSRFANARGGNTHTHTPAGSSFVFHTGPGHTRY